MSTGALGLTGPAFPRPGNYFAAAVRGEGTLTGVLGISQTLGVGGSLVDGAGNELGFGILGFNLGVQYGAYGRIYGNDDDAAGVFGAASIAVPVVGSSAAAGVRGQGPVQGVLGLARNSGVAGWFLDANGSQQTGGVLGFSSGPYGVFAYGNVGASGTKPFIEPHPTDPTKQIVYVALEGPEAGTYFRGRVRFDRGAAVIELPESFRPVTDSEGLSVRVTPIGDMATVAVVSIDLDRISVKGSRDVEFFSLVHGVRKAFKEHEPIIENTVYIPQGPDARMPGAFSPEQRRRLIATGIYNPDGTVNMETARRHGWDKI